jgi:hypothetical protein
MCENITKFEEFQGRGYDREGSTMVQDEVTADFDLGLHILTGAEAKAPKDGRAGALATIFNGRE